MIAQLVKLFFGAQGHSFETSGMMLPFAGEDIRLWARLGGMLQDGGAHKAVWHSRGDGATMACMRCLNLCETE